MLENPLRLLGRLPPVVRLLLAGTFINRAGSFIVPFLSIVLRRELQLSAETVALLIAAYGAGSIVSILTGGALTDRLGRRATLLTSLLVGGGLAIAMGAAPSVRAFVPLLLLFGFVADLYRPAAAAILADVLPSRERSVGFAAMRLAVNLGFAVGMTLGGLIADRSWRLLFVADGATTLVFGALVYFLIPETRPAAPAAAAHAGAASSASPWRDGVFLVMMAGSLLYCSLIFVDLTVLPLTVTLSAGYPARTYGFLVASNGLIIALLEVPLVAWMRDRYRRLRVATLGALLSAVGFGLTGLILHWSWFALTVVLWTLGEILVVPQQNAFVADWSPPEARGRYLALYHATWSLGFTFAPLYALPLHSRMTEAAFWGLLPVLVVPLVACLWHLDRTADHPARLRGAGGPAALEATPVAIASEAEG